MTEGTANGTARGGALRERLSDFVSQIAAAGALIVVFVFLSFASPDFLTADNLFNIGSQTAVVAVIAVGMTLVIITAGIDLSVGSGAAPGGGVGAPPLRPRGGRVRGGSRGDAPSHHHGRHRPLGGLGSGPRGRGRGPPHVLRRAVDAGGRARGGAGRGRRRPGGRRP